MIDLFGENIIAIEETKQIKMEQLLNSGRGGGDQHLFKKCHYERLLDSAVNKKLRSSFLGRRGGKRRADSLSVTRKINV